MIPCNLYTKLLQLSEILAFTKTMIIHFDIQILWISSSAGTNTLWVLVILSRHLLNFCKSLKSMCYFIVLFSLKLSM